jgi:glycine cleavage system H protein
MHPANLKYSKYHVWVRDDGDNTVTLGMTYYYQKTYGNVVYLDLPEVGAKLTYDEVFGLIESNKASNDLISPVTGEVIEVNTDLNDKPVTINHSPYDEGWIVKVRLSENLSDELLTAEQYTKEMTD